jgi:hypothetical protein
LHFVDPAHVSWAQTILVALRPFFDVIHAMLRNQRAGVVEWTVKFNRTFQNSLATALVRPFTIIAFLVAALTVSIVAALIHAMIAFRIALLASTICCIIFASYGPSVIIKLYLRRITKLYSKSW